MNFLWINLLKGYMVTFIVLYVMSDFEGIIIIKKKIIINFWKICPKGPFKT